MLFYIQIGDKEMTLQITEQGTEHLVIVAGTKEFFIMKTKYSINVLCKNAAHSAYRGMGNFFDTWEQAIDKYKSSCAKEAIKTAMEILK